MSASQRTRFPDLLCQLQRCACRQPKEQKNENDEALGGRRGHAGCFWRGASVLVLQFNGVEVLDTDTQLLRRYDWRSSDLKFGHDADVWLCVPTTRPLLCQSPSRWHWR